MISDWSPHAKTVAGDIDKGWTRELRMASDCSGMGVPEMAVSKSIPMQTKVLFACDINPACQKMLRMNFPGVPVLKDVTKRVYINGTMIARRDDNYVFRLPITTDMLDLYVSGFMCSS